MEFGLFLNGYIPGPAAHDPASEHTMLQRELQYAIHADRFNWKYVWIGEHHALVEYSHMSAPEVVFSYITAKTEQIHVGSGIMNLSPPVNQPVRIAERVAMLDHVTENRYEWGTGRGAGSHEMATFDLLTSETKAMWDETAREVLRMFEVKDYTYEGEFFRVEKPHNILPKPYGIGHPPLWVGCGNPGTFTKAGELGIGAIAFNFEPIYNLKGRIEAYKEGIENCTEPLGQYMNNNVMMTNAVVCLSDRKRAREVAMSAGRGYLNTMVNMYHDTMPPQKNGVYWPDAPHQIPDEETLDMLIEAGYMLCGTPDECNEQIAKYQEVGCDQLVFGIPNEGFEHDEVFEMLELFGSKVIPNYDTDPEHSTTRFRREAQRKYPDFQGNVLTEVAPSVIPTNALLPLQG